MNALLKVKEQEAEAEAAAIKHFPSRMVPLLLAVYNDIKRNYSFTQHSAVKAK